MSLARRDSSYYEQFAVQISPKDSDRDLPAGLEQRLRNSLPNFGNIRTIEALCIRNRTIYVGRPNTVIVVFSSQLAVTKILDSSRKDKPGSLWQTNSIMAHPLDKSGPASEHFSTRIVPRLNSPSREQGSHMSQGAPPVSQGPPQPVQTRPVCSIPKDFVPPVGAHHPKSEIWDKHVGDIVPTTVHPLPPKPLQIAGPTPGSPEWMRARIAQLESELDTAKAARDLVMSDQRVIRQALQVEKNARREATTRKSATEAELSRNQVEQTQLRAELDAALAREAVLSGDVGTMRELLILADGELKRARLALEESEKSGERVKALEQQLEEARDRIQKFHLHFERLKANSIELDNTKKKLQESNAEVEQLKAELTFSGEQLEAAKVLLESTEQKYSSAQRMYETANEKLGRYKARVESEDTAVCKLKGTLTPEAYRLLGATYEALGEFLSVVARPPPSEEGTVRLKQEHD